MSAPTMFGDAAVTSLAAGVNPLDATSVIAATGVIGILCVLIAETGLLVGFFLPGDSLLFTAGILAASHGALHLPLGWVLLAATAGALIGAQIGYWIGRTLGIRLLDRAHRPALRRGVDRAGEVVYRYGPAKAIVLSRFIPIVRTVMNPMAGMMRIPVGVFTLWQIIGGLIWSLSVTLAGYWLGSKISGIDTYLLPIIALVVAVSLIPVALEYRRTRRARHAETVGTASDVNRPNGAAS